MSVRVVPKEMSIRIRRLGKEHCPGQGGHHPTDWGPAAQGKEEEGRPHSLLGLGHPILLGPYRWSSWFSELLTLGLTSLPPPPWFSRRWSQTESRHWASVSLACRQQIMGRLRLHNCVSWSRGAYPGEGVCVCMSVCAHVCIIGSVLCRTLTLTYTPSCFLFLYFPCVFYFSFLLSWLFKFSVKKSINF